MVANRRSIRGRRSSPDQGSIVTSRVENESPLMGFPSTNVPFFNANHRRIPSLATDHHPPFAIHGSQFERTSLLLCDIVPLVTIDLAEGRKGTGGRLNRNLCTYSTIRSSSSHRPTRYSYDSNYTEDLLFVNRHGCADRHTLTNRSLMYFLVDKHRTREQRDPSGIAIDVQRNTWKLSLGRSNR